MFQAYSRCASGEIRLASSRECVSPSLYSCNITCGPHGGKLDVEMGMWMSLFNYLAITSNNITQNLIHLNEVIVLYCLIGRTFVFLCDHDVQLSLWALCVCWRALQHILPFQIAPAFWPVLPRWTPIAQPQRKKQHNLDPGKRLSTDKLRISYALRDYGFITANQFH